MQSLQYDLSNWNTVNSTEFRTTSLAAADFDAIGINEDFTLAGEFEVGTELDNPSRVTDLAVGDVVAFSTGDDRFGLIKVVSIEPGFNLNDYIEIEVKVTK
jgi:hypothetical protein